MQGIKVDSSALNNLQKKNFMESAIKDKHQIFLYVY